jgi:hypothetical protein
LTDGRAGRILLGSVRRVPHRRGAGLRRVGRTDRSLRQPREAKTMTATAASVLADIKPGATVHIRIVRQPTREAARKTLIRLLSRDPEARAELKRHRAIRDKHYAPRPRGGRLYAGRLVKQFPVKGAVGESGTIVATTDVLRDLPSVSRFIDIAVA